MGLVAKQTGDAHKPVPAGNYFGVLIGVFDIGTHASPKYGPQHQVVMQFELHKKKGVARNDAGKPLTISKFYTLSFGEKSNLRADVERILGRKFTEEEAKKGYDITELIDRACRLTIVHEESDGKTRDKIDAVTALDEDDPAIKGESDTVVHDDIDSEPGDDVPEWIANLVRKSAEWSKKGGGNGKATAKTNGHAKASARAAGDDDDDDIPF